MEEQIIKKVNYTYVKFTVDGVEHNNIIYGKTNLTKQLNQIMQKYNLPISALDIKMVSEKRQISIKKFLENSTII